MTLISWIGIELSARTQVVLLSLELLILLLLSVGRAGQGLHRARRRAGDPPVAVVVQPVRAGMTFSALSAGLLAAVFIYWGWDSAVAANEETANTKVTPGPGRRHLHRGPARHLPPRHDRGRGVRGRRPTGHRPDQRRRQHRRAVRGRPGRARHLGLQAAGARDPQLLGGVGADHDPADRADHAVDGGRTRRCRRSSARCTRGSRRRPCPPGRWAWSRSPSTSR